MYVMHIHTRTYRCTYTRLYSQDLNSNWSSLHLKVAFVLSEENVTVAVFPCSVRCLVKLHGLSNNRYKI